MIKQRFIPVSFLLNDLLKPCFQQFSSLQAEVDSLEFQIVDEKILKGEDSFFSITDHLATLNLNSGTYSYIQSLSPDQAFLLYVGIQISFLHFHADTQLLPVIPSHALSQNLFAYLQTGYLSFKKHCQENRLSMWECIIDYHCQLICDSNV